MDKYLETCGTRGSDLGSMSFATQSNRKSTHIHSPSWVWRNNTSESFPNRICIDIQESQSTSNNILKAEEKKVNSQKHHNLIGV